MRAHHIQRMSGLARIWREWAGWRGTGRPNPSRETKFPGANRDRGGKEEEKNMFSWTTSSRIGSHTRLIKTLLNVLIIRTAGTFQHAHFIPILDVGKRGAYYLVRSDLPRQHPIGTTLRFTGPVPVGSRQ